MQYYSMEINIIITTVIAIYLTDIIQVSTKYTA